MSGEEAEILEMLFLPGTFGRVRTEPLTMKDDPGHEGVVVNVLVNTDSDIDEVSKDFVHKVESEFPSFLSTSETEEGYHDVELRFDLLYGGFRTHLQLTAWLERQALGTILPPGVDVAIGRHTIKEIRLAMRRAYLTDAARELHPIFAGRDCEVDPNFAFVLMPLSEKWSNRIWTRHVKPTLEALGLTCKRADDMSMPGVIMDDIWAAINRANIVVADLTGRNPNVFYELGIVHVVGVPAILLSQDCEIPAFDVAHHRQIRYQDNSEGCEQLEKKLTVAAKTVLDRMRFP